MGSVLFGPATLLGASWPEWHSADTLSPLTRFSGYRVDLADWRNFDHRIDNWLFSRCIVRSATAANWLSDLFDTGEAQLSSGTNIRAHLGVPPTLLSLFQHTDTPAGKLMAMAARPVRGWVHPIHSPQHTPHCPPSRWSPTAGRPFSATLQLLGLSIPPLLHVTQPPRGLLVGNLQREAWIGRMGGSQPDLSEFEIDIRLDPTRRAVWQLTIDVEETDLDGHLVGARRLRLSDVTRPPHGASAVTVALPTLGRGIVRRIRLHGLDNELLDAADDVRLAERVGLSVPKGAEVSLIGNSRQYTGAGSDLGSRLQALDSLDDAYAQMLSNGLAQRIVRTRSDGDATLIDQLAAARGELLVFDAYFGRGGADWSLFAQVNVPIKVLVEDPRIKSPSVGVTAHSLELKRWSKKPVPFHDRAYLWSGGGLSVGTSPNGLGKRLSLINVLDKPVVDGLIAEFHLWWKDPLAVVVR